MRKIPEIARNVVLPAIEPVEWRCSDFVLRSQLSEQGPSYEPLARFALTTDCDRWNLFAGVRRVRKQHRHTQTARRVSPSRVDRATVALSIGDGAHNRKSCPLPDATRPSPSSPWRR